MKGSLFIAGNEVRPDSRVKIEVPIVHLYTGTNVTMPCYVICSRKQGPTVFVSAAIHGDELNGIEIIQRLIKRNIKLSMGTLILVPMVNVLGVLSQSRYLPDRRDLNRSFPGSAKGSLAGRMAHLFLSEIVSQCDYGIDLHTGAIHRSNFPQIRANLKDEQTLDLARAFDVPVLLNSDLRDGSLRQAALDKGVKILLYEAGEALRFDELSIRAGVKGVLNVLNHLSMLSHKRKRTHNDPFIAYKSHWIRASSSGLVQNQKKLGDRVKTNEILAEITNPYGVQMSQITTNHDGILIGQQNVPLVQEGDAMFHVAYYDDGGISEVADSIEQLQDTLGQS